jgi:hypothetical protein
MKDTQYDKLIELSWAGGGFIPCNQNAIEMSDNLKRGEVLTFQEVTKRDISRHRGYMGLLAFIYDYLPKNFKDRVPKNKFYKWLKHLKGQYEVEFEFADGTKMITYESISFGAMSEQRFRDYIKSQLPFIYENVIGKFFEGEIYNNIVDTIECEFERYLSKL